MASIKLTITGNLRARRATGLISLLGMALAGCGADAGLGSQPNDSQQVTGNEADRATAATQLDADARAALGQDSELKLGQMDALTEIVGKDTASKLLTPTPSLGAPLHSLILENGNQVTWHEPSYGSLLVLEVGAGEMALAREEYKSLTAAELYHVLMPSTAVPNALLGLDVRVEEMAPVYDTIRAVRAEYPILNPSAESGVSLDPSPSTDIAIRPEANPAFGEVGAALDTLLFGWAKRRSADECSNACFVDRDTALDYRRTSQTSSQTVSKNDVDAIDGLTCAIKKTITVKIETRPWWSWSTALNFQVDEGKERRFIGHSGGLDTDLRHTWTIPGSGKAAGCANMRDR